MFLSAAMPLPLGPRKRSQLSACTDDAVKANAHPQTRMQNARVTACMADPQVKMIVPCDGVDYRRSAARVKPELSPPAKCCDQASERYWPPPTAILNITLLGYN